MFDCACRAGLFEAEEATDNLANLKKLLLGRLDGIIADQLSLPQILYQKRWGDEVETLDLPAMVNSVHLVIAKHTHVLDRFNQGLVQMKASGDYNRILDKVIHGTNAA